MECQLVHFMEKPENLKMLHKQKASKFLKCVLLQILHMVSNCYAFYHEYIDFSTIFCQQISGKRILCKSTLFNKLLSGLRAYP